MGNNPFSSPNINDAKLYASWGLDIGYMVNWCITPEQYKELTGKDYTAPTTDTTTA
ncbi:XkdX family protein [Levilactobacillus namurensis]|uniref:XkdX family protein n=1 Tax=Levilactobacillus namurensis TaxID=380393 RepID=A0AAW8W7B4_9LACO|nr:XkdX family protein [Levilactobacillus namurensis]MDT7014628.1 XkdX family protein [Levilactobacillus namurensis]